MGKVEIEANKKTQKFLHQRVPSVRVLICLLITLPTLVIVMIICVLSINL